MTYFQINEVEFWTDKVPFKASSNLSWTLFLKQSGLSFAMPKNDLILNKKYLWLKSLYSYENLLKPYLILWVNFSSTLSIRSLKKIPFGDILLFDILDL